MAARGMISVEELHPLIAEPAPTVLFSMTA
jgi:hypothetical protein